MTLSSILLTKEIRSKDGVLHFRRYRLFSCKYFSIFIHRIYKSDEDLHPHSHPWNFVSIILGGGYVETLYREGVEKIVAKPFSILFRRYYEYHKIELIATTTSLVFTGSRLDEDWGYLGDNITHIQHEDYRKLKNGT